MPQWLKWKSQLFIESDVEGDWVHWIKWPQVDKGKGWMETEDDDLDEVAAWARYWADICWITELNESSLRPWLSYSRIGCWFWGWNIQRVQVRKGKRKERMMQKMWKMDMCQNSIGRKCEQGNPIVTALFHIFLS